MQDQTSQELIDDLYERDRHLHDLTRTFAEIARHESVQVPLCCFYEVKKTKILRRVLSPRWANMISKGVPGSYKIVRTILAIRNRDADRLQLVAENSACLDTIPRLGLDATHSSMNKFDGPSGASLIALPPLIPSYSLTGRTSQCLRIIFQSVLAMVQNRGRAFNATATNTSLCLLGL